MSTNQLPRGWAGRPEYHAAPGAFRIVRTFTLTTNWSQVADIRGLATSADVLALVTRAGLAGSDVARAILKRVTVQNLDGTNNVEVSEWATAGGSAAPNPSDAYQTAGILGAVVTLDSTTVMQLFNVQARSVAGSVLVNVTIWFDVPVAL